MGGVIKGCVCLQVKRWGGGVVCLYVGGGEIVNDGDVVVDLSICCKLSQFTKKYAQFTQN